MEDMNNNAVNTVSRTRYVKKIIVFRDYNVIKFEEAINKFLDSHEVIDIKYNTEYVNEYHNFCDSCLITYIDVIKDEVM